MRKAESRLLNAVAELLKEVTLDRIHPNSAALCIENALTGLKTNLLDQETELLGTEIPLLDFSVRTCKVLRSAGIKTIGDLVMQSADDLMSSHRNCGVTTLNELRKFLEKHNLKLRGE